MKKGGIISLLLIFVFSFLITYFLISERTQRLICGILALIANFTFEFFILFVLFVFIICGIRHIYINKKLKEKENSKKNHNNRRN